MYDIIESAGEAPSDAPAAQTLPEWRSRVSTEVLACGDPAEHGPDGHRGHDRIADGDQRRGD
ncbi:hypothetical protein NE236_42220 [Actinoallomurus purpureus]|uniref:hypothetical protein n=1 Tax=Actinoallomurus purpureus TaxID=478114 RepID=UPI0020921A2E|nr:hypothetical protein [Actinoallomurus purpureus]MCO6011587.1 hypothetical protein [Actinoallomurus purpureus]